MDVYDDIDRVDPSPRGHVESNADFLNRVRGPFWDEVRALVERWFGNLPQTEQADVRGRLRSPDNRQSHGAFWELYLHESLIRAGYAVTPHPVVAGTARRPDFLARREDSTFYLEARLTRERAGAQAADVRVSRIYEGLDKVDSPNFFLWVDVDAEGVADLRTTRLRRDVQSWLASLDPDVVSAVLDARADIRRVAAFRWRDAGWDLTVRPLPKSPEHRGKPGVRPVGVFGPRGDDLLDEVTPLRAALEAKGSAYGYLDHPFVVAVRTSTVSHDHFPVLNALYGSLQMRIGRGPDGYVAQGETRAPDGFWYGGNRWYHRRVSGVLIGENVQPWTVGTSQPILWEHPDSERPVSAPPMWRRAVAAQPEFRFLEPTLGMKDLFGLPDGWLSGDPWAA
jgi:hypothetical protein